MNVNMKRMPWILQRVIKLPTAGITLPPFGIYIRPGYEHDTVLQAHELMHWEQYERMGLFLFYVRYLWGMARYGYAAHPMEIEAREKSRRNI